MECSVIFLVEAYVTVSINRYFRDAAIIFTMERKIVLVSRYVLEWLRNFEVYFMFATG